MQGCVGKTVRLIVGKAEIFMCLKRFGIAQVVLELVSAVPHL